ncbi:MAG: hypothetical protein COT74_12310 [Bdellovibrionales bacterium CG10_big_fil_rev_8_21_14_0_10_45_34]|nr:MAG: hypothetical protein COT74_12310 [Bdellovibrionales bacterium CG10_big_fil_rev_8_21_14_0_10_45_34]
MRPLLFLVTLFLVEILTESAPAKESEHFANRVISEHGIDGEAANRLKSLLMNSEATRNIGTEDLNEFKGPNQSVHPASRSSCVKKVLDTGLIKPNPQFEKICGAKWMAPVPEVGGTTANARVCMDQFEFPNIPCEYPLVWSPASLAKQVCETMGKRVCNSHEWEGACAGGIEVNDPYLFSDTSLQSRRARYNQSRDRVWAFNWNPELSNIFSREVFSHDICGIYSPNDPDMEPEILSSPGRYYNTIGKSLACHTMNSDYKSCGTNTWPAGMKHLCRTQNEIYDLHGNVAEVVNFPQTKEGIARGKTTDFTERKGSFFVVRKTYPDDCRVRQPYEHFKEFATDRHSYYQEGFRCCKDL